MELSQEQLNRIFLYLDGMYSTRLDSLDNLARKNANSLSLIKVQIENLTKTVNSLFVSQNYKLNNGSLTTNFSDFFKTVIKEPNLLEKTILPSTIKKPNSSKNGSTMDKKSKNFNNNYNNNNGMKLVSPKKPQTQTKNSHKTVTNGFIKKIVPLKSDLNNFNSLLVKKSKNYDSHNRSSKSSLKSLNNSFKSDKSHSSLKTVEKSRDQQEKIKPPKTPSRIKSQELFFKNRMKTSDKKDSKVKSEKNIDSSFSKTEKNLPSLSPDNSYSSVAKRKRSNSSYHPGKKKEIIRTIISTEKGSEISRKSSQNLELKGNNEGLESSNKPKEKAIIEKINAQYDILNNILNINPSPVPQKNSIQLEEIIEEETKGRKEEEETEEFLKTEEKVKTEGGEGDGGYYDEDEIM